jgi:hypothetical protein
MVPAGDLDVHCSWLGKIQCAGFCAETGAVSGRARPAQFVTSLPLASLLKSGWSTHGEAVLPPNFLAQSWHTYRLKTPQRGTTRHH